MLFPLSTCGKIVQGFLYKRETQSWQKLWFFLVLLLGILVLFYNTGSGLSLSLKTWTNNDPALTSDEATEQDDSVFYVPYPHSYSLLIDEPLRCQQGAPFLVLMVPVTPGDRTARDAIRRTWGGAASVRGRAVQHYFLLGSVAVGNGTGPNRTVQQQIMVESDLYHDIIQSDFVDSYGNLTVKTLVMLEWLVSHCLNSAYAMKVDSDIFLNLPNLVELLSDAPRTDYVTGLVKSDSLVVRDKTSKWYLPYSVYPDRFYPTYALGLGYVFSLDLPKRILEATTRIRPVYIEDVHMALCLRELGVIPTWPPRGNLFRAGLPFLLPHCYWADVIITLMENSEQLLETWKKYQKQLGYC